uniref:Tachykinin-related peptide 1 n=1 Tax=Rhodnius prolixus TaxID=13249 RepID=TRP1_RHOPR|nr:RecName: Full=Tachykinin-related peptide 1; Short=Rhopr-TRP-1 [Rhodnius prolixus]
SGPGFMGVR